MIRTRTPLPMTEQAPTKSALSKARNQDFIIGIAAIAPGLLIVLKSESFSPSVLALPGFLFCWTMTFCIVFAIRKIQNWGLRAAALVFSSGVFISSLILSIVALPPQWAVGVAPVATYLLTKMRFRHYLQLEIAARLSGHRVP